ncbi:FAD-binding protein [Methyloceanibacter sp.]|uniref:FAD-binding protein n=1 Tax=Methyloceanibacter sp. TaxID=1965321 RepID=UPI003D6D3D09
MTKPFVNEWRNVSFRPARVERPESVEAIMAIVNQARADGQKIKVVGGGHSMNNIFKTDGVLVSLCKLNRIVSIDPQNYTVEVEAGMALGDAIVACANKGLHFPSLGSWYGQSIAGAIATSTHGSSLSHGSLSDMVLEVEAVFANGTLRKFSGDDDDMKAMRCHLGRLGILTKVKLQLGPAFSLNCAITRLPCRAAFRQILSTARAQEYVNMLWIPDFDMADLRVLTRLPLRPRNQAALNLEHSYMKKSMLCLRLEDVGSFFSSHLYQLLPKCYGMRYCRLVQESFFEDQGVIDNSYRVFLYDLYREPTENHRLRMILNVEYAFDVECLPELLTKMRTKLTEFRVKGSYLNYPRINVRFAPKSDATLIGMNADRDTAYVGIYVLGSVQHRRQIPIAEAIENIFIEHHGRPHWGKYRYLTSPKYKETYTGLAAFEAVRSKLDPDGMFSAKTDMYDDLNRFETPPIGAMIRSVFSSEDYWQIRLL